MGTPDPLDALYDGHAPALFRFLVRLTGDEAAVKDILQEIFIRLARESDLLRGVRAPRSFLFRMAHRLAIDHARREEAQARYAQRAHAEGEGAQESAADFDGAWRRDKVVGALAALPPEQRAVVALKVWEELTFAEIGEALEISPDTAASRYRYALDKLRGALRPLHDDLR